MTKPRKPASFRLEEIEVVDTPLPPPAIATDAAQLPATVRGLPALERGWRWGSILLAAVGGLVGLASVVWLHDLVREMMARQDWIGWTTIGLLGLAVLALLMIILREAAGLARLGRLGRLRHEADAAALEGDKALALDVVRRLKRLYHGRKDLGWGLARLAEHEADIMDAAELLRLSERTLVAPLDPIARSIVAASALRWFNDSRTGPMTLGDKSVRASTNGRNAGCRRRASSPCDTAPTWVNRSRPCGRAPRRPPSRPDRRSRSHCA